MPPPLLILGASARAAASSASRAGFAPMAVDLFADRDLLARFPALRIDRDAYPEALADLAATMPDAPWIYTGAIENHPDLVDRIARVRPLLGIGGDALRLVRDPVRWTEVLRRAGLPALDIRAEGDDPPTSGEWLLKPRSSAMGRGIRRWSIGAGAIPSGSYLQSFARGVALAACFVGLGDSVRLAGVTRQILARTTNGLRVSYAGSVGPLPSDHPALGAIAPIGPALARAFRLRGLFGVDLVMDGPTAWPVEINPRYTASVEVLEEALGTHLLAEHARAFGVDAGPVRGLCERSFSAREGVLPDPDRPCGGSGSGTDPGLAAKIILFATKPVVVPDDWPWSNPLDPRPRVADLPAAGTILRPGDPVLTVLARGKEVEGLRSTLRLWRRRIAAWPSP